MKKVVIGVVVGVVAVVVAIVIAVGVFLKTPLVRSDNPDGNELFCGEAKDGEMVEIPQTGTFRLNLKQKELVEKREIISEWNRLYVACWDAKDVKRKAELEEKYPWLRDENEKMRIKRDWGIMVNALEKSRQSASK